MIEDEFISDKGINEELERLITHTDLKFKLTEEFNSKNIIKSLRDTIELEKDEKTKSILALILGLYLVRDQSKDELNEVFKRTAMLGKYAQAVSFDFQQISEIINDMNTIVYKLFKNTPEFDEMKEKMEKVIRFKNHAEPIINSMLKIIDKRTQEINKENEELK